MTPVHLLHPSLILLLRLKSRGWLRGTKRRLSRPAGLLFALIGLALMGVWIGSIVYGARSGAPFGGDQGEAEGVARAMIAFLAFMVVVSSLTHRGLYLPGNEIERLLSAPLSRADLIRYRLLSNLGRSLLFALIMGLMLAPRMPVPGFAFTGGVLAMLTLPVIGQASAILLGNAENTLGRLATRLPATGLRIVAGLGLWAVLMFVILGGRALQCSGSAGLSSETMASIAGGVVEHPVFRVLTTPCLPWARAISATAWPGFLSHLAVALLLTLLLFECTVRLPIDFRELSLATSADVAKKISRVRSGRGAISGGRVSQRALGWTIPWIFGRGPFGAVAWLKLCAIVRKSRGTLLFSVVVVAFATVFGMQYMREPLGGAIFIALLCTVYLAGGLRFDFRGDLDLMETIKTWPLTPWRVFLATILPEAVLISMLATGAIVTRGLVTGLLPLDVCLVVLATPIVCLLWLALDNAVFLLAPVRFVPGQGSAMQHTGRAVVLVALRLLLLGVVAFVCVLAGLLAKLIAGALALSETWQRAAMFGAGTVVCLLALAVLIGFGGWALKRFDVAREQQSTV